MIVAALLALAPPVIPAPADASEPEVILPQAEADPWEVAADPAHRARAFSIEFTSALVLRDDPQGSLFTPEAAFGVRATLDLCDLLPDPFRFDVGLLWYGGGSADGTSAVQVSRQIHTFALPLRAGYLVDWHPFDLDFIPYLGAGPALTLTWVDYRIADPVGLERGVPPAETSASGWDAGALYGAGVGFVLPGSFFDVVGHVEMMRLRRGAHDNLTLGLGVGIAL